MSQLLTLKTLDIKLGFKDISLKFAPNSTHQSFKCLSDLYLSYYNICIAFLSDIHLYCPKLESINIKAEAQISDQILYNLKKLKQLKRLIIFGLPYSMTNITDSGICSLITNCKKLNEIEFNCGIRISDRTFQALKQLADRSPKRRIKFKFCWHRYYARKNSLINESKRLNAKSAAEFWPILNDLPNNLRISGNPFNEYSPPIIVRPVLRKSFYYNYLD